MIKFTGRLGEKHTHACARARLYLPCWTIILLMKNVLVFTAAGVEGASTPPWEGRWAQRWSANITVAVTTREKTHVAITRNVSRPRNEDAARR